MTTLNLGILAHVDAGKTSLTERLLHASGAIDDVGRVDDGNTNTDTLALERARGITIKSAVAAFTINNVAVNLIDTPGHPDFIAEVERVLSVLDGAILLVSAVESVQPQTRVLMRTLRRLRIPTLIFVNKIDRAGADHERVVHDIAHKLSPGGIAMGSATGQGTRDARYAPYSSADADFAARLLDVLTLNDDAVLAAYINDDSALSPSRLHDELAAQTKRSLAYPVFAGSAITRAGIEPLMDGIAELLPGADGDVSAESSGSVFKIERGAAGEKIAYVRMFSGRLRVRDRVRFGPRAAGKITAITVFEGGTGTERVEVAAGEIGKLWGLTDVRIGDAIGTRPASSEHRGFAPPTLETVVVPRRPDDRHALNAALRQLAEQDPLINLRQDDIRQELNVSLYGEVQKEVILTTLANEFDLDVTFCETTTICIERPVGSGAAVEYIDHDTNPFRATVGLRIEPAAVGGGVRFRLEVELGSLPLSFVKAVEETVHRTLEQGIHGWQVTDCTVTMTHSGFVPPPPTGWSSLSSSASDFRNLTPLVLMNALRQADTRVYEPMQRFRLEMPADVFGTVLSALAPMRAVPRTSSAQGASSLLEGEIPAAQVGELQRQLPSLARGEGVLECEFAQYRPTSNGVQSRQRTDHNPLDRQEYLLHVLRHV